ncbi:hypothetical protein [Streptomyces sp. NPDC001108]
MTHTTSTNTQTTAPEWNYPSDAYTALGHLSHLVQTLGNAIEQSITPDSTTPETTEVRAARAATLTAITDLTTAVQRMQAAVTPN